MATPAQTKIAVASPVPSGATSEEQVEEKIRARAYQLYEQRGREEGHEIEDWLQAEAELHLNPRASA